MLLADYPKYCPKWGKFCYPTVNMFFMVTARLLDCYRAPVRANAATAKGDPLDRICY